LASRKRGSFSSQSHWCTEITFRCASTMLIYHLAMLHNCGCGRIIDVLQISRHHNTSCRNHGLPAFVAVQFLGSQSGRRWPPEHQSPLVLPGCGGCKPLALSEAIHGSQEVSVPPSCSLEIYGNPLKQCSNIILVHQAQTPRSRTLACCKISHGEHHL
jgi:hypothetical protein